MRERGGMPWDERELERRSKIEFDRSVGALDAATRSKLTQARHRALEELGVGRGVWRWSWAPAAGAVALAAWLTLWQGHAPVEPAVQPTSLADLEIVLGDDELDMLNEDLDFYAWLESQPGFEAPPAPTKDGVG
jgi:hypothetical protein